MPVRIDHCNPAVGPSAGGIDVTIAGADFTAGATVHFGAQAAVVTNVTADALTVTLPVVAPGPVAVRVDLVDGTTFTLANAFTFHAPTITGIAPVEGTSAGGTLVTITGVNLLGGGSSVAYAELAGTRAARVTAPIGIRRST